MKIYDASLQSRVAHAGEAIIMLLGNYENFANVVAENIIN